MKRYVVIYNLEHLSNQRSQTITPSDDLEHLKYLLLEIRKTTTYKEKFSYQIIDTKIGEVVFEVNLNRNMI